MRTVLLVLGATALAVGAYTMWDRPGPPTNLVLIGIDTLRPDHTSAHGYEDAATPNLDALARRGVRFEEAMSHAPWTLPSVATLLTSKYPSQHGAMIAGEKKNLATDVPAHLVATETLPAILRRHGKRAQAYVANAFTGYGVDTQFDDFLYEFDTADELTDKALRFLDEVNDEPFFLYLHYTDPHEHHRLVPPAHRYRFTPPEITDALQGKKKVGYRYLHENFGFALYDAQIEFTDDQLGRVFDDLTNRGMWDDTLVVVFSDHGEEFWEHKAEHHHYGEDPRGIYGIGHGQSLYQELLSVVLIMAGGGLPEDTVVDGAVGLRDVPVTILDLMALPPSDEMDGASLAPAISAGHASDREIYSEAIAYGFEKKSLRRGRWKYIYSLPGETDELYDLVADPTETKNLADDERGTTEEMRARVFEIMETTASETPTSAPQEISDETRRNLQALGYLTDDTPAARD